MKKLFSVIFLTLFLSLSLFSAQHLSVPQTHRVYDVIASAELRGIINPMATVKPYPKSVIIENLHIMLKSNMLNESEAREIRQILKEFTDDYTIPLSTTSLLETGAYATYWEEVGIGVAFGANLEFQFTQGLSNTNLFDSRNVARAYFKGDILQSISFNMDFGLRTDHVDSRLFIPNDFTLPAEGNYDALWKKGDNLTFFYGLDMHPELAMSLLDSNIQLRFGSIKRDWGVGQNNFMLSGSARPFTGIEVAVNFSSWLQYNFIAGSLGTVWSTSQLNLKTPTGGDFVGEYLFSDGQQPIRLENNLSAHRVEVRLPWNITLGIYESVLYKKRFEIGYLNPFTILMFEQNLLGDFDNMLAGMDFQWRLPGVLRIYANAATTEMNEISKRFFVAPRNILSMQGGIDVHLPVGQFSKFTFQYTYLAPFFYTHYPVEPNYGTSEDHKFYYNLWYVNKGENIGYPLRPNSDEFLVTFDVGLPQGWRTSLTAKYQRRSGQYGFNIDKYMVYAAKEEYEDKNFTAYLFEQTLGLDFTVAKTFDSFPITVSATYKYAMQSDRGEPEAIEWWDFKDEKVIPSQSSNPTKPIKYKVEGPWSAPHHTHALQIGVSIWR